MFGKKVRVEAIVNDTRSSGPGKITVKCDASQMNGVTGSTEVRYRACQAAGIPERDMRYVEVLAYEVKED